MTEELNLPCRYKVFLDFDNNNYYFLTDTGAQYEALFTDGSQLFTSTSLEAHEVYDIIINKTKSGTGKRDLEIAITIEAVLIHFFINKNRFLIYTCDSTDSKHLLRNRLFNSWLSNSKLKQSIEKLGHQFNADGPVFYSSMIYHKENKIGQSAITKSFNKIVSILSEAK